MANDVKIIISAVDKASQTLKKVSGELNQVGKSGSSGFAALASNAKLALSAIGVGIGVAVTAGAAIKKLADGFQNYAFQVEDFGRIIGATPEQASKLIQVADDVRLSTESMTTAMRSAITKGYAPTIENLGRMSDEYLKLAPGIERSRYLVETFGRSGLEMAKLLELGSEKIKEMGDSIEGTALLMTQEGIDAAKKYYAALDELGDSANSIAIAFGGKAAGAITGFTNVLNSAAGAITNNIGLLASLNKSAVLSAEQVNNLVNGYFSGTITIAEIEEAVAEATAKYNGEFGKLEKRTREVNAENNRYVAGLRLQYEEAKKTSQAAWESSAAYQAMAEGMKKSEEIAVKLAQSQAKISETLKTKQLIEAEIAVKTSFQLPDITSELAAWVKSDEWRKAGGEVVVQAYLDLQPRLASAPDDIRKNLAKEIGALELAVKVEVGEISEDEARRQFMDAFGVKYGEAATAIDVAAKIDTSSVDTIKEGLKNDNFLAPIKPEIDSDALAAARAEMAQPISVPLVPTLSGGMGGGKKWSAYDEIRLNLDTNNNGFIGRASGGFVSSSRAYMVGERGPELFVPGSSGTIVPHDKMGGGAYIDVGGIYVTGGGQSPQAIAQAVIAQLNRSMRAARQSGLGYVGA